MDEKKFSFILCTNREDYLQECKLYIDRLEVPEGYMVDVVTIQNAGSMAAGYNQGMRKSDAKYKIYMHQDVFLIYKKFLYAVLEIFQKDGSIGMLGVVGSKKLPKDGIMWHGDREGEVYGMNMPQLKYEAYDYHIEDGLHEVECIDGMLMVTCCDIPWREDLFDGWDYYDLSQSFEFRKKGFKVVVPEQLNPWCVHDDGKVNLSRFYEYRRIFLREYM